MSDQNTKPSKASDQRAAVSSQPAPGPATPATPAPEGTIPVVPKRIETYSVVIFQEVTNDNEQDFVWLHNINIGIPLKFQRGIEVVVPDSYLSLAGDAYHHKFKTIPGQAYKAATKVQQYMWSKLRAATRAEFETALRNGNRSQTEYFQQRGIASDAQVAADQRAANSAG